MELTEKAFFKPDGELIKAILSRMMTRNNPDPITRNADRLQFLQNVSNLEMHPTLHLGFCVQLMERYNAENKPPTFEIGLVMGAAMVMTASSRAGEKILRAMLKDIEHQQENQNADEGLGTHESPDGENGRAHTGSDLGRDDSRR